MTTPNAPLFLLCYLLCAPLASVFFLLPSFATPTAAIKINPQNWALRGMQPTSTMASSTATRTVPLTHSTMAASTSTQLPFQPSSNANDGQDEDYVPRMYIKEIEDPDGWQRPDSGYKPWWYARIKHNGKSPFHPNASSYPVFRNVQDYGARGDGTTLDDDAIEAAMTYGGRCGEGCGSSTFQNAVVYFPPGTYLLSRPIQSYYGTSIVGDPNWRPVLKASPDFQGIALVDEDPYDDKGRMWWQNQVNFFRQTRNIVFDLRDQAGGLNGTGMHRPTSQATALSNCHFELSRTNPNTTQQGISMEAGSGGNMGNLSFRGGKYGLSIGNQQFTVTSLRFESQTKAAINAYWSWVINFQDVAVRDAPVGVLAPTNASSTVDRAQSGQQVAGLVLLDWRVQDVGRVLASTSAGSGVFVLENVRALRTPVIVSSGRSGNASAPVETQRTDLEGDACGWTHVRAWIQGGVVQGDRAGRWRQGAIEPARRPEVLRSLAHSDGRWFTRSRPEYEHTRLSDIIDVTHHGAKGDGVTDDTAALQRSLDRARLRPNHLVFIPHGVFIVTSTLTIHPNIRIVGEAYSVLMGAGDYFNDRNNPQVVFRFGRRSPKDCNQPKARSKDDDDWDGSDDDDDGAESEEEGEGGPDAEDQYGRVEVSDLVFSTRGPAAGAIVVEWNLRGARPSEASDPNRQGIAGMWDAHVRLGGFRGSNLEGDTCPFDGIGSKSDDDMAICRAAFLGFHITRHASAYLSGTWVWLADHDLDRHHTGSKPQISVYSGRGMLIENSKGGPVWFYGVASEHHLLVNFNFYHARNVFASIPQTETPYFQGNGWPSATQTQPPLHHYHDPLFRHPTAPTFNNSLDDPAYNRAIALRMRHVRDVIMYGVGLYSFFNNYNESCNAKNGGCQRSILSIERVRPDANVVLYNLNTAGTDSMLDVDHDRVVPTSFWRNGFTATLGRWSPGDS